MGTRFECVLAAFDRPVAPTERAAVAEGVRRLVLEWHARLSAFDRASVVSAINAQAGGGPVRVDGELFGLLRRCLEYTRDTGGAFDAAVGALMERHGFRENAVQSPPGLPARRSGPVRLDEGSSTVRLDNPGVRLDLGGVAKGFVLDLARAELLEAGVASAMVQGGTSSVIGIGTPPDGQPWRVRVTPDDPDAPVIELTDLALSVSAPGGRVVNGRGHVMDPRTGLPARGAVAACVVGPSAEVCEAWSTAFIVEPTLTGALPAGYRCFLRSESGWRSAAPSGSCCSSGCVGAEVLTDV